MSRKSTASLSVVPIVPLARVAKPQGLTQEESRLWDSVVDSKPADWFGDDSVPLLLEYVRVAAMCDHLDFLVKAAMAGDGGEDAIGLKDAFKLRDMEAKRLLSIGTKLRLTQQSRYTPKAANTASKKVSGGAPWQG